MSKAIKPTNEEIVASLNLLTMLRIVIADMDQQQRLDLRNHLFGEYCEYCGGPKRDAYGMACQCWNDE